MSNTWTIEHPELQEQLYEFSEFPTLDANFNPLPQYRRRGWEPLSHPARRRTRGTSDARPLLKAGRSGVSAACRPRPEFGVHWNNLYAGCPLPVAPSRPGIVRRWLAAVSDYFDAIAAEVNRERRV